MKLSETLPDAPEPEVARQAILADAEDRGWREVDRGWIDDAGLSDADLSRPGIEGALDGLQRGGARMLVVAKRDRAAATLLDVARIMDPVTRLYWALVALEVDVHTTHGRFTVAAFAPYERRLLAERTRAALAAKKAEGVRLGRRRAVPDAIINRVVAERKTGASLYTIAAGLNDDGISGSAGGRWYASTVRSVLNGVERDAQSQRSPIA